MTHQADNHRRLSEEFAHLASLCQGSHITMGALLAHMSFREEAILSVILTFPFLIFIPIPGLSTVFGLCIVLIGYYIARGKKIWIPKRWLNQPLSASKVKKVFVTAQAIMKRVEVVTRPRGQYLHQHPWVQTLTGITIALCGCILAAPLPPGMNFPPALAVVFFSIGTLEEDLVFILLGYAIFLGNIAVLAWLSTLGLASFHWLLNWYQS